MNDLIGRATSNQGQSGPAATPPAQLRTEVRRPLDSKYVLEMLARGNITDANQILNLNLADKERFFLMVLRDLAGGEMLTGSQLRAGQRYRLSISVSLQRYHPLEGLAPTFPLTQYPAKFEILPELTLFVGPESVKLDAIDREQTEGDLADAEITIPENITSPNVLIQLAGGAGATALSRLEYTLNSPAAAPNAASTAVYLPSELPPKTTILYVNPVDAGQIRFTAFQEDESNRPKSFPINRPAEPPPEATDADRLKAMSDAVYRLAIDDAANVTGWLDSVVQRSGDECCLVIVDNADSGIPWEMFKLADNRYLGAVATVVRWTDAVYRSQTLKFEKDEAILQGRVAAYLNAVDAASAAPSLRGLVPGPSSTPDELIENLLRDDAGPVALVYVGHRGLALSGDEGATLESLRSALALSAASVQFDYQFVEGQLKPRPTFFVDSPYSGRVLRHGQKLCGLAQATLTQVASGYVGTLGPVERAYTAAVAEEFLNAAREGVSPARFLRDLRARAVAQLKTSKAPLNERRRQFLNAFMFVYFGNPQMRIRLTGPETVPEAVI